MRVARFANSSSSSNISRVGRERLDRVVELSRRLVSQNAALPDQRNDESKRDKSLRSDVALTTKRLAASIRPVSEGGESRKSLWSIWSAYSVASTMSFGSALSVGSLFSLGSAGSVLSVGSAGSILSIGSVGSICSIGAAGSAFAIGAPGDHGWLSDDNADESSRGSPRLSIIEPAATTLAALALVAGLLSA